MPAYHVERSIIIHKPIHTVRSTLQDFKQWPRWSPWLIMEPDATLTYSDRQGQVGATYGWSGVLVGAGSMELMEVHDDSLKMQIRFVKPFKSIADVTFSLHTVDDSTEVTWKMDGHLPFFMFWMTKKMQSYIGMDYERGLQMLKEYLETGSVASFVHIEGVLPMKEETYIGIPRTCTLKALGTVMKKDFEDLYHFMEDNHLSTDRIPFAIYNTFDMLKGETNYVACIPIHEEVKIEKHWIRGNIEAQEALKTMHKGRYLHLGNAWMTAINFARMKKMKTLNAPVGYEFYPNNPYETAEEELMTEIFLPLK
ncbi:MAG TPA: hypothetical protein ENK39_07250 [Epsilonproteobacteria bacterium]|nr:hypothetical protein [Campylobacterota bacterium]